MTIKAYVLILVEPGAVRKVAKTLLGIEGVISAQITTGIFDIIAYLEVESPTRLGEVVTMNIHNIPGIKSTSTCIIC